MWYRTSQKNFNMGDFAMAMSLARLPSRQYDPSARQLRDAFLGGDIDIDTFLKDNAYRMPRTKEQRFLNQVQSYATASLVIDQFWEFMQTYPVTLVLTDLRTQCDATTIHERLVKFTSYYNQLVSYLQDKFLDNARELWKEGRRSRKAELRLCFFAVARHRWRKLGGLPFPSMKDLVTMTARMAGVVHDVYLRERGVPPTKETIMAALRHPSVLRFFAAIMANDRASTHPFFALLEGGVQGNLNDYTRMFKDEHFELVVSGSDTYVQLKTEVLASYRTHFEKAARRQARRGKQAIKVLGCPALYTGKVRDMYEFLLNDLEPWLE